MNEGDHKTLLNGPKGTLTDIYMDMFLADQLVRERNLPSFKMDSLLVYEAVFNKYGYDTDDYLYSVRHYLKDPERFAKLFEEVAKRLEGEVSALDKQIEYQQWLAVKRAIKYPLADSLLAPFSEEAVFVGLARVERDTSRYPAWFRLVAVQEDTLMISVDSLEARAARDSLAAAKDSLAVRKDAQAAPKDKPQPKKLRERALDKDLIKTKVVE